MRFIILFIEIKIVCVLVRIFYCCYEILGLKLGWREISLFGLYLYSSVCGFYF